MSTWELGELRMWVNLPSMIRQAWVPIPLVIPLLRGLLNQIRQVEPLMSQVRSNDPYRWHPHPPSLSFSSTTLLSLQEHKVKSSISISPCHYQELTLNAVYNECSICRVQHAPQIDCRPFILTISWELQRWSHFTTFPRFRVNYPMNKFSAPCAPPIERL